MDSGVNGQPQQVVVRKVIKVIKRPVGTGAPVSVNPVQPQQSVTRSVQQGSQTQVVRKIIKVPVSTPAAPQNVQQPNVQRIVVQQQKAAPQQSVPPVQQNVVHAPSSSVQSYSSRLNSLQQQAQIQANESSEYLDENDDPNDEVIGYTTYYRGIKVVPLHYEIPDDIMDRIEARKKIPEKLYLLYVYARVFAQEMARKQGTPFPKMYVDLPNDNFEALSLLEYVDDDLYTAIVKDFAEIAQFIPGLPRVMNSNTPINELIDEEVDRVADQEFLSPAQQIVLSFLLVLADMRMVQEKLDLNEIKDDILDDRDVIKQDIEEEENLKRQFVKAIVAKNFL